MLFNQISCSLLHARRFCGFTQYSNQGLKADNFSQNVDYETLNNILLYFHLKIYDTIVLGQICYTRSDYHCISWFLKWSTFYTCSWIWLDRETGVGFHKVKAFSNLFSKIDQKRNKFLLVVWHLFGFSFDELVNLKYTDKFVVVQYLLMFNCMLQLHVVVNSLKGPDKTSVITNHNF